MNICHGRNGSASAEVYGSMNTTRYPFYDQEMKEVLDTTHSVNKIMSHLNSFKLNRTPSAPMLFRVVLVARPTASPHAPPLRLTACQRYKILPHDFLRSLCFHVPDWASCALLAPSYSFLCSLPAMKRKADPSEELSPHKRHHASGASLSIQSAFRSDLFDHSTLSAYRDSYRSSSPYPHAVVPSLINESLLRNVRNEIKDHVHFTLKETDIYRIHQSGDLANLSNLEADSLKHLPNLVRLRDALYSPDFREWISMVTSAGKVSGQKTDMAVNVYTPGCYLLCHDDVIGSRRVSYILYLTDPDLPWRKEWGGGLRLHPTEHRTNKKGEDVKVPLAEHSLNIPPSFGQLSFFAVRPGESYHDVEEVYHAGAAENETGEDGGRIRMAISGWYHIPQEGEDGFEEGVEQAQAQNSSLAQLKGSADEFDEPQPLFKHYDESRTVMNSSATKQEIDPGDESDQDEDILTEQDLTFLLDYISPSFLTPDMTEKFSSAFVEGSLLQLEKFFRDPFAEELQNSLLKSDFPATLDRWKVARPPHKHRYAYLQGTESLHQYHSPIARVLTDLLHSHAFKKWLSLITGLKPKALVRQNVLARRFRRGKDYALASPYTGDQPQLEFTIGITPSMGWDRQENEVLRTTKHTKAATNGLTIKPERKDIHVSTTSQPEFGGEEVYMAGDDDDAASTASKARLPQARKKADPAIYKSAADDEDDGILFTNTPNWNTLSVVLRDKGTLRFVKYVSRSATGDRWDIKGEVELASDAFDEDENDVEAGYEDPNAGYDGYDEEGKDEEDDEAEAEEEDEEEDEEDDEAEAEEEDEEDDEAEAEEEDDGPNVLV
jgi:prolyl 3-hydroxylase /prolyl 3,4-dihydroxylase